MNRKIRAFAGLTAGLMLAAAAASALAQDHPPAPPAAGDWKAHQQKHAEARIHALHDLLNIRADQEDAFKTFISAMRPPEGEWSRPGKPPGEMEHLTTPERLDRMQAREAHFTARIAAIKQFYSVLSPEQQKAFDALPVLGFGRHGHGHGPMGRPGGHQWGRGGWGGGAEGPDGPAPPPPGQ